MAEVLVFGDARGKDLHALSYELIAMAHSVAPAEAVITAALVGSAIGEAAEKFALAGMSRLFVIDDERLSAYTSEAYICAAVAIIRQTSPDVVIFPHTSDSLEWAPRVAARLEAGLVTNCTDLTFVDGELVATKPVCGGAVQAEYTFTTPLKMVTVPAGSHAHGQFSGVASIEPIPLGDVANPVEVLQTITEVLDDGPSLRTARIVVSGGIGIGSAANWTVVDKTAGILGAAVGATRAAVEMGWVSSAKQVGFSGVKVNADVYIAAGISGALHHLAGISQARNVVAINNDPQANIFTIAKYGVVGDVMSVLPAFAMRINELRAR